MPFFQRVFGGQSHFGGLKWGKNTKKENKMGVFQGFSLRKDPNVDFEPSDSRREQNYLLVASRGKKNCSPLSFNRHRYR